MRRYGTITLDGIDNAEIDIIDIELIDGQIIFRGVGSGPIGSAGNRVLDFVIYGNDGMQIASAAQKFDWPACPLGSTLHFSVKMQTEVISSLNGESYPRRKRRFWKW
jgi:hypothetical protein